MSFKREVFERDIARHQMEVIHEDGLHRHIRFQRPGTMCMHFDLITWPGYLCYTGDMGTYVFTRLPDMLQFFRGRSEGDLYSIDFRYWAEKLVAQDRDGVKRFSEEKFDRLVKRYVLEWMRDNRDRTTREQRRELWEDVVDSVIGADSDTDGARKQCAAHDFSRNVNRETSFYFQDFYEYDPTEYTHRFLWCCHALRWAIATYDAQKVGAQAVAA